MIPIEVVPRNRHRQAAAFLATAGWTTAESSRAGDDVEAAMSLASRGYAVLFVPEASELPTHLRRILVVHEGTRGERAAVEAADEAAVASGAEIVILHVPSPVPSRAPASLPYRLADHGSYDWEEWREEFLRRFGQCSDGVRVTLRVGGGSAAAIADEIHGSGADLVVVSTPRGWRSDGRDAITAAFESDVPVLSVPAVGHASTGGSRQQQGQLVG
jgi:nucleotide-binding universal stress UspA family protein